MPPNFKFVRITEKYREDWLECQEFAKTFNHDIEDARLPIIMVKDNGKVVSYFQAYSMVLFFPAFGPDSTPRLTRDAVLAMMHWAQLEFNGFFVAHRPETSPFPEELLSGLHLKKQNYNIWKKEN